MTVAFLLYVATSVLLLWGAGRLVRRVAVLPALVLVALPLVPTVSALIQGEVYAPVDLPYAYPPFAAAADDLDVVPRSPGVLTDLYSQIIPWRAAVRESWLRGDWPLWNPYVLAGTPLLGSAQAAPLFPPTLVGLLLPLAASLTFDATLRLFVAVLAMYFFVRELECGDAGALFAAAAWMLASFPFFQHQWPLGATVAIAPAVLLGVRRVCRRRDRASLAIFTLASLWAVLAGHPETLLHVAALGSLYALLELTGIDAGERLAAAGRLSLGAVAAAGLSAVFLVPVLSVLPQTESYALRRDVLPEIDTAHPWPEVARTVTASFLPFVRGLPGEEETPAPPFLLRHSTAYAGSVVLPFACVGLLAGRWRGRWWLAAVGAIGVLVGAKTPGLYDLVGELPLFDIAFNDRLVFVGALAVCTLAGLGLEAWRRGRIERRRAGVVAALVVVALALVVVALAPSLAAAGLSTGFLIREAAALLIPAVLVVPLLTLRLPALASVAGLLVLLLVQRHVELNSIYRSFPLRLFFPPLDAVASIHDEDGGRFAATDRILPPNTSVLYGLEDVRGYEATTLLRMSRVTRLFAEPHPPWFARLEDLESPLLDFLSVRWGMTGAGSDGPSGWAAHAAADGVRTWTNLEAMPRVTAPSRILRCRSTGQTLHDMRRAGSFADRAWVSVPGESCPGPSSESNGVVDLEVARARASYRIAAEVERPSWIVVAEPAWAGWRAFRAGEELSPAFANHAFLAFRLPPGRHDVEVVYRPRAFELGLVISSATLALLAVALAVPAWRRRGR